MCRHNWIKIVPTSAEMPPEKRVDYLIVAFIHGRLRDIFYCTKCFKTGHTIKSHRGGIRSHNSDMLLERANEIRARFDLPLLNIEQNVQVSDTTGDASSNTADQTIH